MADETKKIYVSATYSETNVPEGAVWGETAFATMDEALAKLGEGSTVSEFIIADAEVSSKAFATYAPNLKITSIAEGGTTWNISKNTSSGEVEFHGAETFIDENIKIVNADGSVFLRTKEGKKLTIAGDAENLTALRARAGDTIIVTETSTLQFGGGDGCFDASGGEIIVNGTLDSTKGNVENIDWQIDASYTQIRGDGKITLNDTYVIGGGGEGGLTFNSGNSNVLTLNNSIYAVAKISAGGGTATIDLKDSSRFIITGSTTVKTIDAIKIDTNSTLEYSGTVDFVNPAEGKVIQITADYSQAEGGILVWVNGTANASAASIEEFVSITGSSADWTVVTDQQGSAYAYNEKLLNSSYVVNSEWKGITEPSLYAQDGVTAIISKNGVDTLKEALENVADGGSIHVIDSTTGSDGVTITKDLTMSGHITGGGFNIGDKSLNGPAATVTIAKGTTFQVDSHLYLGFGTATTSGENGWSTNGNVLVQGVFNVKGMNQRPDGILTIEKGGQATIGSGEDVNIFGGTTNVTGDGTFETVSLNTIDIQMFNDRAMLDAVINVKDALFTVDGGVLLGREVGYQGLTNVDKGSNQINLDNSILEIKGLSGTNSNSINLGSGREQLPAGYHGFGEGGATKYVGGKYTDTSVTLTNGSILDSKHYVVVGADSVNANAVFENTITIDSLSQVTFDKGMYVYTDATVTGGTKASITINADFDIIEAAGMDMVFWVNGMGSSEGLNFLNMDGSDASAAADSLVQVNKTGANAANWEIVKDKNGIYAYDSSKIAKFDTMLNVGSGSAFRRGSKPAFATAGTTFKKDIVVLLTDADYTGTDRITDTGTYKLGQMSDGWTAANFSLGEELVARGYEVKEADGIVYLAQKDLNSGDTLDLIVDGTFAGQELKVGDIVKGQDEKDYVYGKQIFGTYNEAVDYAANHYQPGLATNIIGYGALDYPKESQNSPYWSDKFIISAADKDKGFTISTKYLDQYSYVGARALTVIGEGVTLDLNVGTGRVFRTSYDLDVYGSIIGNFNNGENRFEFGTSAVVNVFSTGKIVIPCSWTQVGKELNIYGNGEEYTHAQYQLIAGADNFTAFMTNTGSITVADYGWVDAANVRIGHEDGAGTLNMTNHGKIITKNNFHVFKNATLNMDATAYAEAKKFDLLGEVNITIDTANFDEKAVLLNTTGTDALKLSTVNITVGDEVYGLGGAFDVNGTKYMVNVGTAGTDGVANDLVFMKAPLSIVVDSTGAENISEGQTKSIDTAFAAMGKGNAVSEIKIMDAAVTADAANGLDIYGDVLITSGGTSTTLNFASGAYKAINFYGNATLDKNLILAASSNQYALCADGKDAVLTIKADSSDGNIFGLSAGNGGRIDITEDSQLVVSGGDGNITANGEGSIITVTGADNSTLQHKFGYTQAFDGGKLLFKNTNALGGMTLQMAGGTVEFDNTYFSIWSIGAWGGSGDGTLIVKNNSIFEVATTGEGQGYTPKFTAGAELVVDWTSQFVYGGKGMILEKGASIIVDFTGFNVTEELQKDQFSLIVKDALGNGISGGGEVEYENLKELEAAGWAVGDKGGQVYIYDKVIADGKDVAYFVIDGDVTGEFGSVVTVNGKDYRAGINAFADMEAAVDATVTGGIVQAAAYTFSGFDVTVSMNVVDMTLGDGKANADAADVLDIAEGKTINVEKLTITESTDITGEGIIKLDRTDVVSLAEGAVLKVTAAQMAEFMKLDDVSGILGSFVITDSCEQSDMDAFKEVFGSKVSFAENVKPTVTEKLPEGGLGGVSADTTVVVGTTGNDKMTVGKDEAISMTYDINMGGGTNTFDVGANGSITGEGSILNVNKLNITNGAKDADKVQQDTIVDLGNGGIETSGAKATVAIGNFTKVTALGGIGKNELGGSNAITIGTNSDVELGNIDNLASLTLKNNTGTAVDSTTSNDTVFVAGNIGGLNSNGSLNFGSNNIVEVGEINMAGGTNSLAIGSNTDFFSEDITGIANLTIGNGTAIKTFVDGDKEQLRTTVEIDGDINAPAVNNKLAIGNFADVEITGGITNTADTGTTLTLGSDSTLAVGVAITGLAGLTIGNGKTEVSKVEVAGGITGTFGNNNVKVGDKASLTIGASLNLMGGSNSLTIGKTSVVEIGNNAKNIQKLTMNGAEFTVAGNYTAAEGKNTIALNAGTTLIQNNLFASDLGSSIAVTVGKADAKLIVGGDMESINSIKTNAGSFVEVGGDIEGTDAKDTFTFGADNVFSANSIDLGGGKDTLTIGASNKFNVVEDVIGANAVTVNGGAAKRNDNKEMIQYVTTVTIGGDFIAEDMANTFNVKNFADVKIGGDFISEGAANVTVGANSVMAVSGDMSGINKLTVAAGSGKEYNTAFGSVETGITQMTVGGDLTGTAKADTITTNKNSELIITGDLNLGDDAKDALKLGADSWTMIGGEISGLDSFAAGKGAVVLATAESIAIMEGLNSKLADVTFVDLNDSVEGQTVADSFKGGLVKGFGKPNTSDTFTLGDSANGWTLTGNADDLKISVNGAMVDFSGSLALNAGDMVSVELFGDEAKKAASYAIDKVLA